MRSQNANWMFFPRPCSRSRVDGRGYTKLSSKKPKLLFDIRGFMPEEYTDAGVWPEGGAIYRAAKRAERWLLRVSDGFVVLTEKARDILFATETKPVEVIPCCVDFEKRFTEDNETLRARMRSNSA